MAGTRKTYLLFNFNVINYLFIRTAEVSVNLHEELAIPYVKEWYIVLDTNFVYIYIYICVCVCGWVCVSVCERVSACVDVE